MSRKHQQQQAAAEPVADEQPQIAIARRISDEQEPERRGLWHFLRHSQQAGWLWRLPGMWAALLYLELLLRFYIYETPLDTQVLLRLILFCGCYAAILAVLTSLFTPRFNYWLNVLLLALITLLFLAQYFYFVYFRTPLLAYSILNAGQITEFTEQTIDTIVHHLPQALAMLLPLCVLLLDKGKRRPHIKLGPGVLLLLVAALCYCGAIWHLDQTDRAPGSPYNCYYNENNPPPTQEKLGALTFMRLDAQRLLLGFAPKDAPEPVDIEPEQPPQLELEIVYQPNTLAIDFPALIEAEQDEELRQMHLYFAAQEPTLQNEYTGLLAGDNLIFIIAEGFSHYLFDTGMFPTLQRLNSQGFEFSNFYTPLWNVSTSDGEYTALTGLLPKSGVWSLSRSAENYLPFALGNQFAARDYASLAYHNHYFGYYDRQLSHPNLGYIYKAQGNGLNVTESWPESDVEMMQLTVPEYIEQPRFHVYYLTVSGHLQYNFGGNNMAARHEEEVRDLPYSDEVRAYIACNLELEYALRHLLEQLEQAGKLENTVIAMCSDHYPYGLSDAALDELAGHTVDRVFELYKNEFILWKQGIEHQVIDEPACSLDILPTLSNLFGLPYDSRLLMGRDLFSDSLPLVIFNDRSWISDRGRYNAVSGRAEGDMDQEYIEAVNMLVSGKFTYSALMLDRDYYRVVMKGSE